MKDAIDPIEQKRKVLMEINAYIGRIALEKKQSGQGGYSGVP